MWLPKDERRLLAGYYRNIGKASGEEVYAYDQLSGLLSDRSAKIRSYDEPSYGSSDTNGGWKGSNLQDRKKTTACVEDLIRLEKANAALHERGLIEVTLHQHVWHVCVVKLTVNGMPPNDSKALSKARMSGSTFSLGTVTTWVLREYFSREAKKRTFSLEPSA